MNTGHRYRKGLSDRSDNSTIYLDIHLSRRSMDNLWDLDVGMIDNQETGEEVRSEVERCVEENSPVDSTILWDTVKAKMRG